MERYIKGINIVSAGLFFIYVIFMFIVPWTDGDWKHVHSVWHSWQALNVGLLAFASSVIAFNIAKYNNKKQREREFVAARSFLPHALSDLTSYFNLCAPVLLMAWDRAEDRLDNCRTALELELPMTQKYYREIFERCIMYGEPEVGKYLVNILVKLQVHQSRFESMYKDFSPESITPATSVNIECYMYCLAELQGLVNKLFIYARGGESFNCKPLAINDFWTAYLGLGIHPADYNDLQAFTQRTYNR